MQFSQRNIRKKSYIAITLSCTITIVALGIAWVALDQTSRSFSRHVHQAEAMVIAIKDMYGLGLQQGQAIRNIIADPANPTAFKNLDDAAAKFSQVNKQLIDIAAAAGQNDVAARAREIYELQQQDYKVMQEIVGIARQGDKEKAFEHLNTKETPLWRKNKDIILGLGKNLEDHREKSDAATQNQASLYLWLVTAILALPLIVSAGFAWLLTSAFRTLSGVTGKIQGGTDHVVDFSRQVTSIAQSLSEGASAQAAGLEETSSSLEEMASMTKQTADNAGQAKTMMEEVRQTVENVDHHMTLMAEAIGEVTRSSEESGKIIKTIDEIAFQTNLLALNAAVEAARAGEAGAGFAVVASEVRNLAMRAAEAARSTSELIEKTLKSVQTGNELTVATQEAFRKNREIAEKIGHLVDEIAIASQEQAQGIAQVSKAVADMDRVTQQNAANAEESAAAAEDMNGEAVKMKTSVAELVTVVGQTGAAEKA
jgi:methyl-accepting chemotaxis protein